MSKYVPEGCTELCGLIFLHPDPVLGEADYQGTLTVHDSEPCFSVYEAAPAMLEALRLAMEWSEDGSPDSERSPIELNFRNAAQGIFSLIDGGMK